MASLVATLLESVDFAEVRLALKCFVQTVFVQRFHSEQASLSTDILGWLAVECHLANTSIHSHQFMHSDSTSKARVVAMVAALSPHERRVRQHVWCDVEVFDFALGRSERLDTLAAVSPGKPLAEDRHNARRDEKRLNMHINKTRN